MKITVMSSAGTGPAGTLDATVAEARQAFNDMIASIKPPP